MSCPIWEHEKIFSRLSGSLKTIPDEKVEAGSAAFSAHKLLSGEGGAVTCLKKAPTSNKFLRHSGGYNLEIL